MLISFKIHLIFDWVWSIRSMSHVLVNWGNSPWSMDFLERVSSSNFMVAWDQYLGHRTIQHWSFMNFRFTGPTHSWWCCILWGRCFSGTWCGELLTSIWLRSCQWWSGQMLAALHNDAWHSHLAMQSWHCNPFQKISIAWPPLRSFPSTRSRTFCIPVRSAWFIRPPVLYVLGNGSHRTMHSLWIEMFSL